VEHRAHTGRRGAPQQDGNVHGQVAGQLGQTVLADDGMLLEGCYAAGVDLLVTPSIDGAASLDPVPLDPGQDHLVADLYLGNRWPSVDHGSRAFMTKAMWKPFVLA